MNRLTAGLTIAALAIAAALNVFVGAALAAPKAAPTATAAASAAARPWEGRITVVVVGKKDGPDVVLIPGLTSSRAVWDGTVKQLEGRYRLHLVQVNGFAGSEPRDNADGPVIQPVVEAIDAYIAANGLKKPAVIGHSMGGLVGLMLTRQHPEHVGRLLIVDSLPFFGVLMNPAADGESIKPQAAQMRDMMAGASQEQFAAMERGAMGRLVKDPEGLKTATEWAVTSNPKVTAQAMYDDITTDMRPELAKIATPVTLLYPWDAATGAPQAMFDQLYTSNYASLPGVKVKRIDGSFHFIMLDQPAAFAAEVEAFLK